MTPNIRPLPFLPLGVMLVRQRGGGVMMSISDFVWRDGDDEGLEFTMHPDEIAGFIANWFPKSSNRRLN